MKSDARRTKVRVQRDAHLRLRNEECRDEPPYLRQRLDGEDVWVEKDKLRQADDTGISQCRYSNSRSGDGPRDRGQCPENVHDGQQ